MGAPEDEEELLRSAAMQNANSILLARRRAEQALARKTEDLAHSLSLTRATLESTTDGILVTDQIGRVTGFNEKFVQMWRVPRERMDSGGHQQLQEFVSQQVQEPDRFLARIREIYASWPSETSDVLEFMDGRVFERYSKIQRVGELNVGRVWSFRDITERKRAEAQLHQQREWFRVTLSSVGDAVITTDTDGKVTFLNPVAEMMTGWKSAEAAGLALEKVFTIINEETRKPVFNPVARVLREGVTVDLANHTSLISRDGIETAIEDSAAPIKDTTGRIIGVVMVFHDVTERRKTEMALRISHAQFSAIINQSPVGIFLVDDQLHLRHVNPKARPTFGNLGDLVGRDWVEVAHVLWPKTIAEDIVDRFRHTLKTGESYISPGFVADRADRKAREYYDWQIHRVTLPESQYGIVAYFTDTSAHVLAQQALRESEGRFRASFNQAAVGMAMAALNGRFEQVNQRMADILGYSPEELCERTFIEITHPEDKPQTQTEVRRLLAGEIPDFVLEKRYVRNDGRVVWSLTVVSLLTDPEGRPQRFIGVVEDITQRKQAEESIREAAERLTLAREAAEQANHAKDHFLAALSHELRTPMTPVLALLTNLCEQTSLPMGVIRDLETMRRNVELEARLIDDLLDLTRVTRGKLELHFTRTRIGQVIEDAIETCLSDLKTRRLSLFREIDNPQKTILVDGARITQILWNLLKNSIKFTPEGGTIIIRSRVQTDGEANQVTIEVQDTGMGIEPEPLHRVFEAFEQGDRKITRQFGGLGLGLAISKAIAESHNGTLTATSEGTGRGSTFKLALPAEELEEAGVNSSCPSDEGKLSETAPAAARVEPSLRILLVEDHTDTAKSLSMLLERRGYIVSVAGDVASALKLAATQPFDLLLSDIGLPDATGYELMSQIREHHSIPGIALSGYGMEEDVRKCHEAGFSEHLVKPVRISQLEESLARIIPRR